MQRKAIWGTLAGILLFGLLFSIGSKLATFRASLREPVEPDLRIVIPDWFLLVLAVAAILFTVWFWTRKP